MSPTITNISPHGFWLYDGSTQREHFLSFREFPWFSSATVAQISNVALEGRSVLHWPDLDVDLDFERIEHPDRFPLISDPQDRCDRSASGPRTAPRPS